MICPRVYLKRDIQRRDINIESKEKATPRYFIEPKRYTETNRSFASFVESRLCSSCRHKSKAEQVHRERSSSAEELLTTIKNCCSQAPEFITPKLPLREVIFRLFLANGNQPLTVDEILEQLKKQREQTFTSLTPQTLAHLLDKDSYYGISVEKS